MVRNVSKEGRRRIPITGAAGLETGAAATLMNLPSSRGTGPPFCRTDEPRRDFLVHLGQFVAERPVMECYVSLSPALSALHLTIIKMSESLHGICIDLRQNVDIRYFRRVVLINTRNVKTKSPPFHHHPSPLLYSPLVPRFNHLVAVPSCHQRTRKKGSRPFIPSLYLP